MAHHDLSIDAVERETGLSKDILRKWETRYGVPTPRRDKQGRRLYSTDQVTHLQLVRRLMIFGLRPAQLLPLSREALEALARERADVWECPVELPLAELIEQDLLRGDGDAIDRRLDEEAQRMALETYVTELLAPLIGAIGEAWARGRISIHHEHLFTDLLQRRLRRLLDGLPVDPAGPRVLLTTLPGEVHTLGLTLVQVLLTLHGGRCIALGAQLPAAELADAARQYGADIVGLSFSLAYPKERLGAVVKQLRTHPALRRCALWIGGGGSTRISPLPPGVMQFSDLQTTVEAFRKFPRQSPRPTSRRPRLPVPDDLVT